MKSEFNKQTLVDIFDQVIEKFGKGPASFDKAGQDMVKALISNQNTAMMASNPESRPGVIKKYCQIWAAASNALRLKHKVKLNSDYWAQEMLRTQPLLTAKAFPGKQAVSSNPIYI